MTAKSSIRGIKKVENDNRCQNQSKKYCRNDKYKKEPQRRDYPL